MKKKSKVKMLKYFIFCISLLVIINVCIGQGCPVGKKFTKNILEKPNDNKVIFEKSFNYKEIYKFKKDTTINNAVILANSYARYQISNAKEWKFNPARKVKRVDIVYTKYPFNKEDWLTNYYELLANRLKTLFLIDPTLNNSNIQWNLVLQTACKTDAETRRFFHGIVIYYDEWKKPLANTENEEENEIKVSTSINTTKINNDNFNKTVDPYDEENRTYTPSKTKKKTKPKGNTCPSFK
jgi:hypothetical protein